MNRYLKSVLVLVSVSTIFITTACAQLPKSGAIKAGPDVNSGLGSEHLYFSPFGPGAGANQEDIILGFLNAATGPQNDYAIAKSYLSDSFKANWDPNNEVLIQDGTPTVAFGSNDSAEVVFPISARINNLGQYQELRPGSTETMRIKMGRENGEWRIISAPNLITVIRPVFDVVFKPYALYFVDNQLEQLVPDVRWFPVSASTSTRLVNALLSGPSEWLSNAVRSAIPTGAKLSLSTVKVTEGIATVDLSSEVLEATARERKMIHTQIHETLVQLNSVYSVNVTVQRSSLDLSSTNTVKKPFQIIGSVALYNGELTYIHNLGRKSISGSGELLSKFKATDFAINSEEKIVLLTTKDGIYRTELGRSTEEPKLLAKGGGYLAPILDQTGYAWVIPKSSNRPILVFDPRGEPVVFPTGWLSKADRVSFSISTEGSRIVVATGTQQNSQVYLASIIRDEDGLPIGFGSPIKPINQLGIQSVTWLDNIRIGVLSTNSNNYAQPWVVMVGGDSDKLAPIRDGMQIVGSGKASSVFVLDLSSNMYKSRGSSWGLVATNVEALHSPGN